MAILKDNEYTEFEGRDYANPQVSLDESNAFIDNLRSTQQADTQQIKTDTYNLGTAVPSNLGGLIGGEGYWTSRYQAPQTNAAVDNLKAAAQAKALNDVLANEQAIWEKRYRDTYRDYQKRQNAKSNGGNSGGGSNNNQSGWNGEFDLNSTDEDSDDPTSDGTQPQTPPKESDYMITGEEQNKKIEEQTGIPAWWVNILKIFG